MNYSEEIKFFKRWKKDLVTNVKISRSLYVYRLLYGDRESGSWKSYRMRQKKAMKAISQIEVIKENLKELYRDQASSLSYIEKGFECLLTELQNMDGFLFNEPPEEDEKKKTGPRHYPEALSKHIMKLVDIKLSKKFKYDLIAYFKPHGDFDSWLQKNTDGILIGPTANPLNKGKPDPYDIKWIEGFFKGQENLAKK